VSRLLVALALVGTWALAHAGDASLVRREWTVGGTKREAFVHAPPAATTTATPVVFVFHGHGGTARYCAEHWALHDKWPEALVVYAQGLKTPTRRDPNGEGTGWQTALGEQGDRDLLFIDAVLASLEKDYKVDTKRVFATGHSNGGGFCYLLWAERGDRFTAFAPVAAAARSFKGMKPHPALQVAGKNDQVLPFASQEQTMKELRRIDECEPTGKPWEKGILYPSRSGAPFVAYVHDGGHEQLDSVNELVVKFFRELPR
jgi:polyhydroxybutyrate depolymerase